MVPNDPVMLLSFVNTKLRDEYSDLDKLCEGLDLDKTEIIAILKGIGYSYNQSVNQFK